MISFWTEIGGSNGGGGKGPAKDLYGGQAQNENELFAQDQVKWIDFQPKRSSVWITTCTFSALYKTYWDFKKLTVSVWLEGLRGSPLVVVALPCVGEGSFRDVGRCFYQLFDKHLRSHRLLAVRMDRRRCDRIHYNSDLRSFDIFFMRQRYRKIICRGTLFESAFNLVEFVGEDSFWPFFRFLEFMFFMAKKLPLTE